MIGYLRGELLETSGGRWIVLVGQGSAGIGYSVNVPQSASYGLVPAGSPAELFVHTHVREDALELFGFLTRMEKSLFLTLLSVNGIGPKGALSILSGSDAGELIHAIVEGDKGYLHRLPGVGKKTAERLVLELADPVRKKIQMGEFVLARAPGEAVSAAGAMGGAKSGAAAESAVLRDARAALIGLGYREGDVAQILSRVLAESEAPPARAEDLIRRALRQLS